MATETYEQRMERACRDLEIPGAVVVGGDASGNLYYEKVFGRKSIKDMSKDEPMTADTTMWLASCTKLVTTIAAMQCVERGQLDLEGDVTVLLPELKGLKILKKFDDDGKPVLEENTKVMTLKHLLTHSSGLCYDKFNPLMKKYRITVENFTPTMLITRPVVESCTLPLIFEPGASWEYSVGLEWAGKMVERVSGMDLESYFQKYIWSPLGTTSLTFYPKRHTSTFDKLAVMSVRQGGISPMGLALNPQGPVEYMEDNIVTFEPPDAYGGGGLFGNVVDYSKILQSICADDGKLLQSETIELMFQDHLSAGSKATINWIKANLEDVRKIWGGIGAEQDVSYGLGGMLLLQDEEGARRKGSMNWGGYPNLNWWIDREAGVWGISGTQICPPGDVKHNELSKMFERDLYQQAAKL